LKTYEGLFIFSSSLKEEERGKALERVRGELARAEATVLGVEQLGRRAFARPIRKRESGYYVRVVFECDPQAVATLTARYKLNTDLLRVQFLVADEKVLNRITSSGESATAEVAEAVEKPAVAETVEVNNG